MVRSDLPPCRPTLVLSTHALLACCLPILYLVYRITFFSELLITPRFFVSLSARTNPLATRTTHLLCRYYPRLPSPTFPPLPRTPSDLQGCLKCDSGLEEAYAHLAIAERRQNEAESQRRQRERQERERKERQAAAAAASAEEKARAEAAWAKKREAQARAERAAPAAEARRSAAAAAAAAAASSAR